MKAARGQWAPYHVMLSKTDIKFCHPESLKLDPTLNISLESELFELWIFYICLSEVGSYILIVNPTI